MRRVLTVACVSVGVCLMATNVATKPDFGDLPHPTGKFAVGRVAYDWADRSRADEFSKDPQAHRELMVYVWYPADFGLTSAKHAQYMTGADSLAAGEGDQEMSDFWGESWERVRTGGVESETLERPPIASGHERFPVITFSPGLGVPVVAYTSLIEEVVSHGYVVVAIEPTYEAPAVVFADGRVIAALPQATDRHLPTPPGENREQFIKRMHKFDEPHIDRWAADIRFVVDQVSTLNSGNVAEVPFAGHLDLQNVAAWGHSFGGRAAARACQLDKRMRACLDGDGLGPDGPIFVFEGEALPTQPFLWMEVHHEPPTDAQLAPYGTTRKEWDKNHQAQIVINERQLRECAGESFHVVVNTAGVSHYSFTDLPFLQTKTETQRKEASVALRVIATYTVAFFDRELKHDGHTVLDENNAHRPEVAVERYGNLR